MRPMSFKLSILEDSIEYLLVHVVQKIAKVMTFRVEDGQNPPLGLLNKINEKIDQKIAIFGYFLKKN